MNSFRAALLPGGLDRAACASCVVVQAVDRLWSGRQSPQYERLAGRQDLDPSRVFDPARQ
jgi:hypothetical protein